jgi:replicative DNA helicase
MTTGDILTGQTSTAGSLVEPTGPATLAAVMQELETQVRAGETARLRAMPTGFQPLDDLLNGGIRAGELMVIGGPFGVGKTIWGLQAARNAVVGDPEAHAIYVCYEHDRTHLLLRLLCLESAERGHGDEALTLRKLSQMATEQGDGRGLLERLARAPRYAAMLQAIAAYQHRLTFVKASGDYSTVDSIREWVREAIPGHAGRTLMVVDYLQKIPVLHGELQPETEVTTYLTQSLKEMAMSQGVAIIAIAASDREGLRSKRMRLSDMRGSSALQYEADIGLVLNNKYAIVSREHMVYNPGQAEGMRNWVVLTIEKNRAGRNAVDMEYALDAAHFRMVATGNYVRERLVDEKVVLA